MRAAHIQDVALAYFANHGYEGASLADIASEVGIKTPSIYAHFKGKEELYLSLVEKIAASELLFVSQYFEHHAGIPLEQRLLDFLILYKERYERDLRTKFWLRNIFFPPAQFHDQIEEISYMFLDSVEKILIPIFEQAMRMNRISPVGAELATAAYIGLLDSMLVERLHGGPERSEKRLKASWHLFWRGLSV